MPRNQADDIVAFLVLLHVSGGCFPRAVLCLLVTSCSEVAASLSPTPWPKRAVAYRSNVQSAQFSIPAIPALLTDCNEDRVTNKLLRYPAYTGCAASRQVRKRGAGSQLFCQVYRRRRVEFSRPGTSRFPPAGKPREGDMTFTSTERQQQSR